MALSATTLADYLDANTANTLSEADARNVWAAAYRAYFEQAVQVKPANLGPPETAMRSALTGMSATNGGATKIQEGIIAFWATMSAAPSTYFQMSGPAATTVTAPPGLTSIAAGLEAIFPDNRNETKAVALANVADVIHTNSLGGSYTAPPGGTIYPIT